MIRYKVVISREAFNDLVSIKNYIFEKSLEPIIAGNLIEMLKNAAKSLSELPYRHPLLEHSIKTLEKTRMFNVKRYVIYYKIDKKEKTVTIVKIVNSRRDFEKLGNTN